MAVEAELVHRGHRGSNGPSRPGTLRREAYGRHDRRGEEQPRPYALPPQTSSRRDPERRRGRAGFHGNATGVVRSGALPEHSGSTTDNGRNAQPGDENMKALQMTKYGVPQE